MIVPRYWAEARLQRPASKAPKISQLTLRRFGWSNEGQSDAQAMADVRVADAMARANAGEQQESRDPRVPYNGADGVPIREQIVEEQGASVITRNAYGAMCLNTPDVLFVDMDDAPSVADRDRVGCSAMALGLLTAVGALIGLGWAFPDREMFLLGIPSVVAGTALAAGIFSAWDAWRRRVAEASGAVRDRVSTFVQAHPGWIARLYRTPAGHRLLVMHRTFQAAEPAVAECFASMKVDPAYARMCRHQQCFRARLTPKPWRMGMVTHIHPRPGTWPVRAERLAERTEWLTNYDELSRGYAACRFLQEYGSGVVHPEAARVRDLHDARCGALGSLPLA